MSACMSHTFISTTVKMFPWYQVSWKMKGSKEWDKTPQNLNVSVCFSTNDRRGTGIAVHGTRNVKHINIPAKYMT